MSFRPIRAGDVEQLFDVRERVRENVLTRDELARMGITPPGTIAAMATGELHGHVCEISGRLVGFSMANVRTQEIAVIAVLPDFEGQGIGRELLRLAEEVLWTAGCSSIWLWTWPDRTTRAMRLYERSGWIVQEVKEGRLYLAKDRPKQTLEQTRLPIAEPAAVAARRTRPATVNP